MLFLHSVVLYTLTCMRSYMNVCVQRLTLDWLKKLHFQLNVLTKLQRCVHFFFWIRNVKHVFFLFALIPYAMYNYFVVLIKTFFLVPEESMVQVSIFTQRWAITKPEYVLNALKLHAIRSGINIINVLIF